MLEIGGPRLDDLTLPVPWSTRCLARVCMRENIVTGSQADLFKDAGGNVLYGVDAERLQGSVQFTQTGEENRQAGGQLGIQEEKRRD